MIATYRRLAYYGFILASLLGSSLAARAANLPEAVAIPSAGLSSAPAALNGFIYRPAGPGPHAAIVMMHGCSGAYNSKGGLSPRHAQWGQHLAAQGYVALMLDSFTARGIKELCTQKFADRNLKEADRIGDAYAALLWLRSQPEIDAQHIGLLGWSHGGGVALAAMSPRPRISPGFAATVAFYPGCSSKAVKADKFRPYAPLLVLIGDSDDWTPAAPCKALTTAVAARGEPMQIISYADSYHDFDAPGSGKVRLRKEVPNGVNPGQGVHVGPNPVAREDALQQVPAFFARYLK